MSDIKLSSYEDCPFSGSMNSCGACPTGEINYCPTLNDVDELAAPSSCPLMSNPITVSWS